MLIQKSGFKIPDVWKAAAIYLGLAFLFWFRLGFLGRALFHDCLFKYFFPEAAFFRKCLLGGEWPFWNPHIYSGVPFLANLETSVFYPSNLLHLFGSFSTVLLLSTGLHACLAGVFMFLFSRSAGLSFWGALISGIVYGFNGTIVGHYAFPTIYQGYAWLPFIMLCLRKSIKGKNRIFIVGAGVGLALQIFAGHPQFVFYSILIMGIYAFAWDDSDSGPGTHKFGALMIVCSIVILSILLTAVQLIPTIEFVRHSPRISGKGFDWATEYSLKPVELIWMNFAPVWNQYLQTSSGDPHVVGFYTGWTVLVLSVAAVLKRTVSNRRDIWASLIVIGFGMTLSLGKYLPGYRVLFELFFPFRIFRFPGQALYLSCFGFAVLAGAGLESFLRKPWWRWGLIGFCGLELWIFSFGAVQTIDPVFYQSRPSLGQTLTDQDPLARFMMTPKTRSRDWRSGKTLLDASLKFIDSLYPNLAEAFGRYDADGLEELRFESYDKILNAMDQNPLSCWIDVWGIRYIFSFWENLPSSYQLITSQPFYIYENPRAYPKAYLVPQAVFMPHEQVLPYVDAHPHHDFRNAVIIESPELKISPAIQKTFYGDVQNLNYKSQSIQLKVACNSPAWLVVSDSFDPGWRVCINGRKGEVYRANYFQRAILLKPGSSEIEFNYRPPYFYFGLMISIFSLLVSIYFAIRSVNNKLAN